MIVHGKLSTIHTKHLNLQPNFNELASFEATFEAGIARATLLGVSHQHIRPNVWSKQYV